MTYIEAIECCNCKRLCNLHEDLLCMTCHEKLQTIAATARGWQEHAKWIAKKHDDTGQSIEPFLEDLFRKILGADLGGEK